MAKEKTNNKRSRQGLGSIRKRSDGRWEGRYTVGYDPLTGKQKRRSVYAKGYDEVLKKIKRLSAEVDFGTYIDPSNTTVQEWMNQWVRDYTLDLKPLTLKLYKEYVTNRINPALGKIKLTSLSPQHIQAFYGKLNETLSPKTITNIHGVLHKGLGQALKLGMIAKNPTEACTKPRVIKRNLTPLDTDSIMQFLNAIKGHKYESFFTVAVFTGMRQSELIGLSWDCIDFEARTIWIYRQLQKRPGGDAFAPLKNNKGRLLMPSSIVLEELAKIRKYQELLRDSAGSAWHNPENLVFTTETGEHIKHHHISKRYKTIVKGIGRPELRFHDLRHSFAVLSLQAGDDIKTVQDNLGHHSAAFTMDTYAHVTTAMRKSSARRMDKLMESVRSQPVRGQIRGQTQF